MTRCEACPGINTCVKPDGPTDSRFMFIGEYPNADENKHNIPFIYKIGKEINEHYLPCAGLKREDVYFTHALKCLPDRTKGKLEMKQEKDKELALTCARHHLYREIEEVQPEILIPLGPFACFVLDPDIYLDLHHGIPLTTDMGTVFPMYNPSGAMFEPKKMLQIRTDYVRLKRFIRGKLRIVEDQYPDVDYREADPAEFKFIDVTQPMGNDTEYSKALGPYCLTYSTQPGTGRLIKAESKTVLKAFQKQVLDKYQGPLLFHNWMADRDKVMDMGLIYPDRIVKDTMIRAFHLGCLPQGLKTLAYRELGMEMQDFLDLVKPFSTALILDYFKRAQGLEWTRPEPAMVRDAKTRLWKVYKAQSMSTKLKRFFTDCRKNPDKDVFEMWDTWEDAQERMVEELGPYPEMDIRHVPFDLLLFYACRDSDATLRIWPLMEYMKSQIDGQPQENWQVGYGEM